MIGRSAERQAAGVKKKKAIATMLYTLTS